MFPAPVHWASDAQHHTVRNYGAWQQLLHKAPKAPAQLDVDGQPRDMLLVTHTEEHPEASMARRMRSATLDFEVKVSGKTLLKRLKNHIPGKHVPPLTAGIDGASLVSHLAHLAHEPEGHETRFDTAFVMAIHLREVGFSGVSRAAGPCSGQLLFKDCVFDKTRGKIVPSSADRPTGWKAYLRPSGVRIDRSEGKTRTEVYALRLSPGMNERAGPGQILLYSARTGLDTRLLLHMDAGSVGLHNQVVYHNAAPHVRAPLVGDRDELTCPDSLSWFTAQAWARMYKGEDFNKKLGKQLTVFSRRDELDRFRQATTLGEPFVPRSQLHEFDAYLARSSDVARVDKDHVDSTVVPVTPFELTRAYDLFHRQTLRANRGVVDFTKGIRAVFEPFDCDAWRKHVHPADEISITLVVDLVYVPLLNWLDTRTASAIESKDGDEVDNKDDSGDGDADADEADDISFDVEEEAAADEVEEEISEEAAAPAKTPAGAATAAHSVL